MPRLLALLASMALLAAFAPAAHAQSDEEPFMELFPSELEEGYETPFNIFVQGTSTSFAPE